MKITEKLLTEKPRKKGADITFSLEKTRKSSHLPLASINGPVVQAEPLNRGDFFVGEVVLAEVEPRIFKAGTIEEITRGNKSIQYRVKLSVAHGEKIVLTSSVR